MVTLAKGRKNKTIQDIDQGERMNKKIKYAFAPVVLLALLITGCSSKETVTEEPTMDTTTTVENTETLEESMGEEGMSEEGMSEEGTAHAAGHHHLRGNGLKSMESGYEIKLINETYKAKKAANLEFTLTKDGEILKEIPIAHEYPVHLVVVAKNLSWYSHIHPVQDVNDPQMKWVVPINFPYDGEYRVIAQFNQPMSDHEMSYAIGAELKVGSGKFAKEGILVPPFQATQQSAPSKFNVTLDSEGPLTSEEHTKSTFTVKDSLGNPVSLGMYLKAGAHIFGFRVQDGAYVHLHGDLSTGSDQILVDMEFTPGPGKYRLFVEFMAAGRVERTGFTVDVA
jgi:hypothetical protein